MAREEKVPLTTTLSKSVKQALRRASFEQDRPMGEIIEEGLAAIGLSGSDEQKDQSSEKDSRRK